MATDDGDRGRVLHVVHSARFRLLTEFQEYPDQLLLLGLRVYWTFQWWFRGSWLGSLLRINLSAKALRKYWERVLEVRAYRVSIPGPPLQ